jgi:hypothetical protein
MKLKLGDNGAPVYQDGKLVLVGDDGSETPFDAVGAYSTFAKIREERDGWKSKAEGFDSELTRFGKSPDERAKTAERAKLASQIDEKKLIDAGKVDEVVSARLAESTKAWDEQRAALEAKAATAESKARRIGIESKLRASKVFDDYLAPTKELFVAKHLDHFDFDGEADGVAGFRDAKRSQRLYRIDNPNAAADVDESIRQILKLDPNHDSYRKGSGANGSGAPGNPKVNADGSKSVSPEEFTRWTPAQQMKFSVEGGAVQ